jgi:hypothetical protein
MFCVNEIPAQTIWDNIQDTLTLELCHDASLVANLSISFAFQVLNPMNGQEAPPVYIKALDAANTMIHEQVMHGLKNDMSGACRIYLFLYVLVHLS